MRLHNQLELLLVTTFVRMMFQTLAAVSLLDVLIRRIAWYAQDLVVILGLGAFECGFGLFEF